MKPLRVAVMAGVIVVLGALAIWLNTRRESEPVYAGKSASWWLQQMNSGVPLLEHEATNAFIAMGTNAVPFLKAALSDRDSLLSELLMDVERRCPGLGLDFICSSARFRRSAALDAAMLLGTNALPILPEIAEGVGEWGSDDHADFLITNFQTAALKPIAMAMTNSGNMFGERTLLESLGRILRGFQTPPADEEMLIANLTCVLRENWDEFVDRPAAYAIGGFGSKAERAIPVLLDRLTNREAKSSYPAAWALAAIGRQPEKVLPVLPRVQEVTHGLVLRLAQRGLQNPQRATHNESGGFVELRHDFARLHSERGASDGGGSPVCPSCLPAAQPGCGISGSFARDQRHRCAARQSRVAQT